SGLRDLLGPSSRPLGDSSGSRRIVVARRPTSFARQDAPEKRPGTDPFDGTGQTAIGRSPHLDGYGNTHRACRPYDPALHRGGSAGARLGHHPPLTRVGGRADERPVLPPILLARARRPRAVAPGRRRRRSPDSPAGVAPGSPERLDRAAGPSGP